MYVHTYIHTYIHIYIHYTGIVQLYNFVPAVANSNLSEKMASKPKSYQQCFAILSYLLVLVLTQKRNLRQTVKFAINGEALLSSTERGYTCMYGIIGDTGNSTSTCACT